MEAMGNAATPYNANSSRFGRCTSLGLDPNTGVCVRDPTYALQLQARRPLAQ